jgi:hypothetical protein
MWRMRAARSAWVAGTSAGFAQGLGDMAAGGGQRAAVSFVPMGID